MNANFPINNMSLTVDLIARSRFPGCQVKAGGVDIKAGREYNELLQNRRQSQAFKTSVPLFFHPRMFKKDLESQCIKANVSLDMPVGGATVMANVKSNLRGVWIVW